MDGSYIIPITDAISVARAMCSSPFCSTMTSIQSSLNHTSIGATKGDAMTTTLVREIEHSLDQVGLTPDLGPDRPRLLIQVLRTAGKVVGLFFLMCRMVYYTILGVGRCVGVISSIGVSSHSFAWAATAVWDSGDPLPLLSEVGTGWLDHDKYSEFA